uniref:Glycosyltransferase n=1 Tax=Crocosmia x crocosmiiflora TaxID=1053288 RepID=A0A5B8EQJ2_CROXC|nr:glycosyltransferase [Crocosmia x crocosmiiflora]
MSSKEGQSLHILFFPFMAPGHFQPVLYMAERFAAHGVRVSILTTPANVPLVQPSLDRANIELHNIPFPSAEVGLPEGCENLMHLPSLGLGLNFYAAILRLQEPFDKVLRDLLPDCVVTDALFPWSYASTGELNIPRLVFHPTCLFSMCADQSLQRHRASLLQAAETVVIPGLPHRIEMLTSLLSPPGGVGEHEMFKLMREADAKSYGTVVNSFFELEPDYLKCLGRKAWPLGPVAPIHRDNIANAKAHDSVEWLGRKSPGSTVYICFGSTGSFTRAQMQELALGLESSDHQFVWVLGKDGNEWIPQGFEERVSGKGLIVRGWAPQMLILNHPSVGGFVTHCGWNSCLEGVTAGLPLVTWPMNIEDHFYNERMIVDVLRIGVSVGVKKLCLKPEDRNVIEAEVVKKAVDELMGSGEAADLRRQRARELGEKARKAVEKGGSSYVNMANLIQELIDRKNRNSRTQAI